MSLNNELALSVGCYSYTFAMTVIIFGISIIAGEIVRLLIKKLIGYHIINCLG